MPPKKQPWVAASQSNRSNNTTTKSNRASHSILLPNKHITIHVESKEPPSGLHSSFSSSPATLYRETGIISRLCRTIMDTLACLITLPVTYKFNKERNSLQRCHATLKLWTNGHHVWKGELDQALQGSKDLRHATLSVLLSLCMSLQLGLRTHIETAPNGLVAAQLLTSNAAAREVARVLLKDSGQPTSDTDSSDDDEFEDDFGYDGIDKMTNEVKIFTNCLLDLSGALDRPALDANHVDAISQPQHDSLVGTEVSDLTVTSSLPVETGSTPSWLNYAPPVLKNLDHKSYSTDIPKKRTTKRNQLAYRVFQCPFRKAQEKLGLPFTCTAAPVATVSAVRTHLTRGLPGRQPPHLPFLKHCSLCKEDILDEDEFMDFHGECGLQCETPRPQPKGDIGQGNAYDLLYSKVEGYIVAQRLEGTCGSDAAKDDTSTNTHGTTTSTCP